MGKKFIGWVLNDNKDTLPDRAAKDGSYFERAKKNDNECSYAWKKFQQALSKRDASTLPYTCTNSSAVVYKDEIHLMGSLVSDYQLSHYKWNGSAWSADIRMPHYFYRGYAASYKDKIYIFGGGTSAWQSYVYSFDGTAWTQMNGNDMYESYSNSCLVYNNTIHILGNDYHGSLNKCTVHSSFDGTTFKTVSTIPVNAYLSNFVLYNNEIHLLGGQTYAGVTNKNHYKWNGSTWTKLTDLPIAFSNGWRVVSYKNKIYIINASTIYIWDGNTWTTNETLKIGTNGEVSTIFKDEIHVLGGGGYPYTAHKAISETSTAPEYLIDDNPDKFPLDGTLDGYTYKRIN